MVTMVHDPWISISTLDRKDPNQACLDRTRYLPRRKPAFSQGLYRLLGETGSPAGLRWIGSVSKCLVCLRAITITAVSLTAGRRLPAKVRSVYFLLLKGFPLRVLRTLWYN